MWVYSRCVFSTTATSPGRLPDSSGGSHVRRPDWILAHISSEPNQARKMFKVVKWTRNFQLTENTKQANPTPISSSYKKIDQTSYKKILKRKSNFRVQGSFRLTSEKCYFLLSVFWPKTWKGKKCTVGEKRFLWIGC